jgi:hypothetical protein
MYFKIDLQMKVDDDGVECRKRLDCFTYIFHASISNAGARKKREIE